MNKFIVILLISLTQLANAASRRPSGSKSKHDKGALYASPDKPIVGERPGASAGERCLIDSSKIDEIEEICEKCEKRLQRLKRIEKNLQAEMIKVVSLTMIDVLERLPNE